MERIGFVFLFRRGTRTIEKQELDDGYVAEVSCLLLRYTATLDVYLRPAVQQQFHHLQIAMCSRTCKRVMACCHHARSSISRQVDINTLLQQKIHYHFPPKVYSFEQGCLSIVVLGVDLYPLG